MVALRKIRARNACYNSLVSAPREPGTRLDTAHHTRGGPSPHSSRRVAFASLIGTTIEWYDFFIFGTAAALIFNEVFFPVL